MAKNVKKDSSSEFPKTLLVTINDRNDDGEPFFCPHEEGEEISAFYNDEEPYVAVYQLVKVQRLEKIERLVDL